MNLRSLARCPTSVQLIHGALYGLAFETCSKTHFKVLLCSLRGLPKCAMVDFNTLDKIEERDPEDSEAEGSMPEGSGPDYYGTADFGTGRSGKIFKKRASVKQKINIVDTGLLTLLLHF